MKFFLFSVTDDTFMPKPPNIYCTLVIIIENPKVYWRSIWYTKIKDISIDHILISLIFINQMSIDILFDILMK